MLISEKYKFIFIHIQKTGGTSIMEFLKNNVEDLKPLVFKHDGAIEGINEIGIKKWNEYFKFAFVRNPWDRLVSWYSMIVNTPEKVTKLREYARNKSNNFEEFITNCPDSITDVDGIQSFVKNQYEYLIDENGRLVVDYVGKFENLDNDIAKILKQLNLNTTEKLPLINHSSTHKHYSKYYTNKTKKIVEKRFKKDIEYFKYEFRRENILDPIKKKLLNRNKKIAESSVDYMVVREKGRFN